MEKEVEEYLIGTSRLLNGQLRGFINEKAREENLELIQLTMGDVFNRAYELGNSVNNQEQALKDIKNELGIKEDDNRPED